MLGLRVLEDALLRPVLDPGAPALYRDLQPPPAPAGAALTVTWLGTAGVLVSDGETRLLVDPFVSRPGLLRVGLGRPLAPREREVAAWLDRLEVTRAAAVLVSHSHYDHVMDAPAFARATGAVLVGSSSTANVGRGAGVAPARIRVVADGDAMTLGRFRVTFLESAHGPALRGRVPFPGVIARPLGPPAPASAYRLGACFGLVIEHPAGTLVHHGSAGTRPGMYAGVRAGTVLLGLAGRAATEPYLRDVVDAVGAARVIPIHFDDFFRPLAAPLGFLAGVRFAEFVRTTRRTRPRMELTAPPLGRPVALA
ncbi:MAG TPA: MBL fold metallo-hydrolase [Polyangia bacterium]|jgi:L-ascorbate metabolism protein UlaG (beta-lactamase superfamily)